MRIRARWRVSFTTVSRLVFGCFLPSNLPHTVRPQKHRQRIALPRVGCSDEKVGVMPGHDNWQNPQWQSCNLPRNYGCPGRFNNLQSKSDRDRTRPILLSYLGLNSAYSEKQADRVVSTARQRKTPAITQIASKMQNELYVSILTLRTIATVIQFEGTGK